jgi:hypothetical protein
MSKRIKKDFRFSRGLRVAWTAGISLYGKVSASRNFKFVLQNPDTEMDSIEKKKDPNETRE